MDGELGHCVGVSLGILPQVEVDGDGEDLEWPGRRVRGGTGGRQLVDLLLDKLLGRRGMERGEERKGEEGSGEGRREGDI